VSEISNDEKIKIIGYRSQSGENFDQTNDLVISYKNLNQKLPENVGFIFKNLIFFDVSVSKVKFIAKNDFENMKNLKHLRLYHNEIEELPTDVFEGLENLEILNLSSNKIKSLPKTTFANNWKLKILWINENSLERIETETFENNLELQELHFRKNKIKFVGIDFRIYPNLESIDFSENYQPCDLKFDGKFSENFNLIAFHRQFTIYCGNN
jgi:Leucine-rich repeat (LRR) protein